MKNTSLILAALFLGLPVISHAQVDLGSNGSYGPMTITTATTLTIPEDGIFHCTTISITGSASLSFTRNNRNTPVYLLATGDVLIDADIFVDGGANNGRTPGNPGPGGYGGAQGANGGQPVADGYGPGGGKGGINHTGIPANHGGSGAYGTRSTTFTKNGAVYGNPILIPLVGGSGGGSCDTFGGGGGGGAILIGSNTKITMNGNTDIYARGGTGTDTYNHGSGGAVRLVAPEVISNGSVYIVTADKYNEGHGRVRIDAMRRSIPSLSVTGGAYSTGSNMVVFPPNIPDLKIVEAAGQVVNPNQATPLLVTIPPGASAIQPVKVKAQNFGGTAPVTVVLTPEFGPKTSFNLDISNPGPSAAEASVDVTFPINVTTRVDVWTR